MKFTQRQVADPRAQENFEQLAALLGDSTWTSLTHIAGSQDLAGAPCKLLRRSGFVTLNGICQVTSAHAAFSQIAQLPDDFWPLETWRVMGVATIGGVETFCGLTVMPTGVVQTRKALAINDWVSLATVFPLA